MNSVSWTPVPCKYNKIWIPGSILRHPFQPVIADIPSFIQQSVLNILTVNILQVSSYLLRGNSWRLLINSFNAYFLPSISRTLNFRGDLILFQKISLRWNSPSLFSFSFFALPLITSLKGGKEKGESCMEKSFVRFTKLTWKSCVHRGTRLCFN